MNPPLYTKLFLILLCVAPCFLSGCVPRRYVDAPGVVGQVVNRTTKRPVPGATVSMTSQENVVKVRTDQSGNFTLPAIQAWHLPLSYIEGHVMSGILRVEAAGYHPLQSQEGEAADALSLAAPGIKYYPSGRDDLERVRIALTPDA